MTGLGALLGLVGGAGLVLFLARAPWSRRPSLASRVEPYLGLPAQTAREVASITPFVTLERIVGPTIRQLAQRLDGWLGGRASLARRLERSGVEPDVERFRIEQVVWAAGGFAGALALAMVLAASGRSISALPVLILAGVSAIGGALTRERVLDRAVVKREATMLAEFPTIAELIALSVAAGEGAAGALTRVTNSSRGELAQELVHALDDVRAGAGLVEALRSLADRTALPTLARFVDGVVIAVERGTPLADVLRAQAGDVRDAGRRELMESAGKREIAMMIPVVFLVLPVTVLFALFPGFYGLSIGVS